MDQISKKNYIPSILQFSASKLFFQNQNQLLQKIWFISPMTIDIHFKYTFQEVQSDFFIEWWEFEWITVDHDVHEQWIIYKIWFLYPKFQNVENLTLDLKKNYLYDNPSVWALMKGFVWRWMAFVLLLWFSIKFQFWQILLRLNGIGAGILLLFYIRKIAKILYNLIFQTKRVEYWWFKVIYKNQSDALMLSSDVIHILRKMKEEFWITKFCYTWNCIYLLQDLHDRNWKRLTSTSKLYSEQEKANLQQKTMNYLHQSDFLSKFITN